MKPGHRTSRWVLASSIAILCAGCASTDTAQKAADAALTQISVYDRDVSAKIKAEDDYYQRVMNNATRQVNRLRQVRQPFKVDKETARFADDNKNKNADQIAGRIPGFMEQAGDNWADRESEFEQLLTQTRDTLSKNRRTLAMERAKISQLKAKLRSLSEGESAADMLALVIAFSKEVKTKLDELEDGAK